MLFRSEVKNEITAEIKRQMLSKKYAETAEVFSNTVYEQADSLKPVADKLKLKVETVSGLTREINPKAPPGAPTNNERFLKAMFSDETIKNKRNSEAVEIAPNVLIAGRVVEYKPKTKRPFDEVKAAIKERLTLEQATVLAKQEGEAKLAKLKEGAEASGFGDNKTISRTKRDGVHPAVLAAAWLRRASASPAPCSGWTPLFGACQYTGADGELAGGGAHGYSGSPGQLAVYFSFCHAFAGVSEAVSARSTASAGSGGRCHSGSGGKGARLS